MHKFRNTEAIEDLVLLLNHTFDALNGRQYKDRIWSGNWQQHKRVLLELLQAIDDSEAHLKAAKDSGKSFVSDTSLKAMRVTLHSAIQLVEFLLEKCNYDFVLTGKFNQDCIEVFKCFRHPSSILDFKIIWFIFRDFLVLSDPVVVDRMPQQPPVFCESAVCCRCMFQSVTPFVFTGILTTKKECTY